MTDNKVKPDFTQRSTLSIQELEKIYQKMSIHEHVLARPDCYIGKNPFYILNYLI